MASNRARHAIETSAARIWQLLLIGAAFALTIPQPALAVPVQAHYIDSTDCDSHGEQFPTHELGEPAGTFPIDELIQVSVQAGPIVCVPDDGDPNDFLVSITNMGSVFYENLFLVVDTGSSVGNFDGFIEDLLGPPGVFERAFKIDGTVTAGINSNLVSESMTSNEIFEPGETWEFLVTNFTSPASLPPMPVFDSPGVFAGSSPTPPSNASIVATPVPEPSTGLLLGMGVGALALLLGRAERSARGAGSHGRRSRSGMGRFSSLGIFAIGMVASLTLAMPVRAVPVNVAYVDTACDPVPDQVLIDEIGLPSAGFPAGEALSSTFVQPAPELCTGNGIAADDFEVTIVNLTPFDFADVFFVADLGISVGNADGVIIGGGGLQDAFRIDSVGLLNPNLIFESGILPGIWESGETWRFLVTDFGPGLGFVPLFGSIGVLGVTGSASTASIVAGRIVPEPGTLLLFGSAAAGLAFSGRRRWIG